MKAIQFFMFFFAVIVLGVLYFVWQETFALLSSLDGSLFLEMDVLFLGITLLIVGIFILAYFVRKDLPVTFIIIVAGGVEILSGLVIQWSFI